MNKKSDNPKKKRAEKAAPKPAAQPRSATGKTKRGEPKKRDYVDTRTVPPTVPEPAALPEHFKLAEDLGLTAKQVEFVNSYLTCYNGAQTYMRVYGTTNYNVAAVEASNMLRKENVSEYLAARIREMFKRSEEAADKILQTYMMLAYGDVNELVEFRRDSCRFCHGKDHRYQSTPAEYEAAKKKHEAACNTARARRTPEPQFDEAGGVGYDPRREPHPDCPECHGRGVGQPYFHDTRHLSPAALALYEGVEITKDGIKVKIASRQDAREKLAKILKIYEDSTQVNLVVASTEELDAIYTRAMEKTKADEENAKERMSRIAKDDRS